MPHEVIMPALGMAQDTGKILCWLKKPGDAVKAGDALFEVETDKATMEVEAPSDGYLTDVQAGEGDEVPVGNVIALISETAEGGGAAPPAAVAEAPAGDALPEGEAVIMPALGMAQDTGLIVAWHKAPGDAVAASDILFEVETDKSTMEVEAGIDGFLAAVLIAAGEEAPVGETIAVISAEKPAQTVQVSRSAATGRTPASAPAPRPETKKPAMPAPAARGPARGEASGRILASPKARRLALQEGLDLGHLVEAGYPQPYHAADLEILRKLPARSAQSASPAARRLIAQLPVEGFSDFAVWAAQHAGLTDSNALLAGFAAAGLPGEEATVVVERWGQARSYTVLSGPLSGLTEADADSTPDLRVRDLRASPVSAVDLGPEEVPVLTLTSSGSGLSITLECASHHLTATEALSLLSDFAGRMEEPLRHLL